MIAVVHLQKQILYLEFFCIVQVGLVGFDASSDTIGDHRIIIRPLSLTWLNWEMFKSRSMQKKGFLPGYMVWWARVTRDSIVNRSTIALTLNFWGKLPSIHVLSDTWLWRLVTIDLGIFLKDCRWNTFPTLLRNNWDLQKTEKNPIWLSEQRSLGEVNASTSRIQIWVLLCEFACPTWLGGCCAPRSFVICYSIRSFKVYVTRFLGRTTTKIITFFQESFPNLETLKQLSGRPRGIWCYTEPPPPKTCILRGRIVGPTRR